MQSFARICVVALSAFILPSLALAENLQTADPPQDEAARRIDWWRKARFGMFIHWGLYAIPAKGEWHVFADRVDFEDYKNLSGQFRAEHFDPAAWAAAAKQAGMGYMVLTARHQDGFSLWDSPSSFEQFTSMRSAAKRDFVAEYTAACRAAGLGGGIYYSPLDWRFPGFFFPEMYRKNAEELRDQTYSQVQELLGNYGKIDILWYDGGGDDWLGLGGLEWSADEGWHGRDTAWPQTKRYSGKPLWEPEKLQAIVRRMQPGIITNDRSGTPGDFESREFKIGNLDNQQPWEKCTTLTGSWGYTASPARSLRDLLGELSQTACRDGNLLLSVGPRPDGSIDPGHLARLHEIGEWMKVNGEAIHGTRGGPLLPNENFGTTTTGSMVYVHVWKWPADGKITLSQLPRPLASSATLSGDAARVSEDQGRIVITRSSTTGEVPLTIIALKLADTAAVGPDSNRNGFGASDTQSSAGSNASAAQALHDSNNWVLRWQDEFDKPGLPDPARWNYESGRVRNGEAQYYTTKRLENARIEDGHLIITARKEPWDGAEYTSASLTTLDRFALTYGKIEISAKVPAGRGTWPALWTLANYDPHVPGG